VDDDERALTYLIVDDAEGEFDGIEIPAEVEFPSSDRELAVMLLSILISEPSTLDPDTALGAIDVAEVLGVPPDDPAVDLADCALIEVFSSMRITCPVEMCAAAVELLESGWAPEAE